MKTLQDILRGIDRLDASIEVVVIDLFCGAGGYSWGAEQATVNGQKAAKVLLCVNHDALAIESHYANMPDALHFVEDIRTVGLAPMSAVVERVRTLRPDIKILLHASLECTNHSRAKGGMSRDADSRTLAEHLFRYVTALSPDYISIENVVEFMEWGPLQIKVVQDKATGEELYCPLEIKRDKATKQLAHQPVWVPVSERKGEYYTKWVADMRSHGYSFEYRVLNAADYGAHTSRKRYFGLFAKPGLPIAWPEQTHSKAPGGDLFRPLKKWKPVREVLDFSVKGESVFDRKKPLVDATIERITAGVIKFVAGGKDKFLVKYNSMSQRKTYAAPSVDDPCPVVSTQGRIALAATRFIHQRNGGDPQSKVYSIEQPSRTVTTTGGNQMLTSVFMVRHYSGHPESKCTSLDAPAGTITTVDHHAVVYMDFLSAYYGNGHNHSVIGPAPTLTTKDRLALVRPCFLDMQYGNGTPSGMNAPAPTVTAKPKHQLVVCRTPWVMDTNFGNTGHSIDDPAHTVTADRHWSYLMNPQFQSAGGSVDEPCFTLIARMDKRPPSIVTAKTSGTKLPSFVKRVPGGFVYEIYDTDSPAVVKLKEAMALYGILDVEMRMLLIPELKRIMGFPTDYVLKGRQEDQKRFIGNAVDTKQARANVEALVEGIKALNLAVR